MTPIVSAFVLALAAPASPAVGAAAEASAAAVPAGIDAEYSGYLLGIKVLTASLNADFGESGTYESEALFETAGLVRWFKKAEIHAEVEGELEGSYPQPESYSHTNRAGDKDRTIQILFEDDEVTSIVEPRFGSMGEPPATMAERLEAVDALSGILQMALNAGRHGDQPCGYDARIFDGKQRYDLRMSPQGERQADLKGYEGPVIVCNTYYVPVSGFDPEDLPNEEERNTPLEIWFADTPQYGVYMPVRFELNLDFGRAVIEVRDLDIDTGAEMAEAGNG